MNPFLNIQLLLQQVPPHGNSFLENCISPLFPFAVAVIVPGGIYDLPFLQLFVTFQYGLHAEICNYLTDSNIFFWSIWYITTRIECKITYALLNIKGRGLKKLEKIDLLPNLEMKNALNLGIEAAPCHLHFHLHLIQIFKAVQCPCTLAIEIIYFDSH